MATKKIYYQTVLKWAAGAGVPAVASVFLIFWYLAAQGMITVQGYSGDVKCAGDDKDPCYAYMNITVQKDNISIYPVNYDPYGRNTPFDFMPGVKDWKFQVKYNGAWKTIDLTKPCIYLYCGAAKNTSSANAPALILKAKTKYQLRIIAYKYSPYDKIKWSAFGGLIDPVWLPITDNITVAKDCFNTTIEEYSNELKTFYVDCENLTNGTICNSGFYNKTVSVPYNNTYETCNEIGIVRDNVQINYSNSERNCLRTDNIVCCWSINDGGINIEHRATEYKKIIRSGEKGICYDLNNNLSITSQRNNGGDVKLI